MLRFLNLQTKHFLINWRDKSKQILTYYVDVWGIPFHCDKRFSLRKPQVTWQNDLYRGKIQKLFHVVRNRTKRLSC